jgi:thymidylate kinase
MGEENKMNILNMNRKEIKEIVIIILEGNECTFKSTIGKELSYRLDVQLRHGSSFQVAKLNHKDLFNHYLTLANGNEDVIYDRFIYSNRVYASLYQDCSILSLDEIKIIEGLIRSNHEKVLVVHCCGYEWDILERMRKRGDEYVKEDMIVPISQRYDKVMREECGLPKLVYNSSLSPSERAIEWIIDMINKEVK